MLHGFTPWPDGNPRDLAKVAVTSCLEGTQGRRRRQASLYGSRAVCARVTGEYAMGAELYQIAAREDAELDIARLLVLRQALGDERCREVVEEVVFHLTDRLTQLRTVLAEADHASARALACRLASLSEQVGLADFSRVARDLYACLVAQDLPAAGAVGARLMRLGEESLFSVLVYADQSAL